MSIRDRVLGDGNTFAAFNERPKVDVEKEIKKLKKIILEDEEKYNVLFAKFTSLEKENERILESVKNKKRKH